MFEFIKYIHPINYYRLVNQMPQAVLVCTKPKISIGYTDERSELIDQAYLNLQRGVVPIESATRSALQNITIQNRRDNYIFIRRYFSKLHVLSVLFLRVITLHNPFLEFFAFIVTSRHKRIKIEPINYTDFQSYESKLINQEPLVSVVIPTLNRYSYLKDVLSDLENQAYKKFEVIVCDQSEPYDPDFYKNWNLKIHVIRQTEKALWLARNTSIKFSNGEYVALTEDDVRIPNDWLKNHLIALDFFNLDISAGQFFRNDGKNDIECKFDSTFKLSHQFPTGNALLKSSVFEKVGLFDRQFEKQRMGDGEFGLRALLNGFNVISNPLAFIIDIKAPTGGLRQMGSWDALRPTSIFAPRPVPSVLYFCKKYFNNGSAYIYLFNNIPQSYIPYMLKTSHFFKLAIYILLPILLPLAIVSVTKAWALSSEKLRTGPLIDFLND